MKFRLQVTNDGKIFTVDVYDGETLVATITGGMKFFDYGIFPYKNEKYIILGPYTSTTNGGFFSNHTGLNHLDGDNFRVYQLTLVSEAV